MYLSIKLELRKGSNKHKVLFAFKKKFQHIRHIYADADVSGNTYDQGRDLSGSPGRNNGRSVPRTHIPTRWHYTCSLHQSKHNRAILLQIRHQELRQKRS